MTVLLTSVATRRRFVLTAVMSVTLLIAAACGGKDSGGSSSGSSKSGETTTTAAASLLGAAAPATGTPVKVGLITNGGQCSGCGNKDEEPVAQATVDWLNQHQNGLAGHKIDLDVCVDDSDPGKTSDCANQMIRDDVAAVVIGTSGVIETSWKILHDAHIPVINQSTTNTGMLQDSASTFILNDPAANTIAFPIGVAKDKGTKKVSVLVVDVPAATDIYKTGKSAFEKAGLQLQLVPVALGTPDMTPQAQQIVAKNPDGLVMIVGHDQICIPAIQGLYAVGFHGSIATISQCVTDAMRKAIPSNQVKGIQLSSIAPLGDENDESLQQYEAVVNTYAPGKGVDLKSTVGIGMFESFGALGVGTKGLNGTVSPASVTAALKSMKNETLPGSGGLLFRCNGKASASSPGVCSAGVLTTSLDANGNTTTYKVLNNKPIGD
jgi:branched-chain amino acid transport system substrate-binding protein